MIWIQLLYVVIIINGDGDSGSLYRRTHSLRHMAWYEGRRQLGAILHSSNEPGELSQWLCHDDSTINIVWELLLLSHFSTSDPRIPHTTTNISHTHAFSIIVIVKILQIYG